MGLQNNVIFIATEYTDKHRTNRVNQCILWQGSYSSCKATAG